MSRSCRSRFRPWGFRNISGHHASIVGLEDTFSGIDELDAKPRCRSKTTIRPKAVPPDSWDDISGTPGYINLYHRVWGVALKLANTYDSVDEIVKILTRRLPKVPLKECIAATERAIENWNWQYSPEEQSLRREGRRFRRKLAEEYAKLSAQHKEPELPKNYEADLRESKRRFRKKTGCAWAAKE